MIHTSSNQLQCSIAEYSCLLGRWGLVLPHLCHSNKQRTSTISTSERSTLVPIQLEQWRDILYPWNIITRHWQSQWSCSRKSPKQIQRHPHPYRVSHQLRQQRRRPNQWTDLPISNQLIYDSSNNTHCPSSPWGRQYQQYQYVDCHGHYNPITIQHPCWRNKPVRQRTTRSRSRRRPPRKRRCTRKQQTRQRQCPTSPTGGKAHGHTTNNFWRRLFESWEFHQGILHLPPS